MATGIYTNKFHASGTASLIGGGKYSTKRLLYPRVLFCTDGIKEHLKVICLVIYF